jgi:hypothetical protein
MFSRRLFHRETTRANAAQRDPSAMQPALVGFQARNSRFARHTVKFHNIHPFLKVRSFGKG